MAKFRAVNAVSKIEYDLNPYVDAKGHVPEPSEEDVDTLLKAISETMGEDIGDDPDDIQEALAEKDFKEIIGGMTKAVADLCNGFPSLDEIEQLPFRVRQQFFNYVIGEVTDPEKSGGASKPSPKGRRGA